MQLSHTDQTDLEPGAISCVTSPISAAKPCRPDRPGARSNYTGLCLCAGGRRQGWEEWGSWSSCSASCGLGVGTRYMYCQDMSPGTEVCKVRHSFAVSCHACLIIRDHKLLLASACLPIVPVFSQVLHLHHHLLHAQPQSMEPPHVHVDAPTSFTPRWKT